MADNGHLRDDRANHDHGEQGSRIKGVAGDQQADGAAYLEYAREVGRFLPRIGRLRHG